MIASAATWALLASLGPREIMVVVLVVLVLYGRSGVFRDPRAQAILPWLSPRRRTPASQATTSSRPSSTPADAWKKTTWGDRVYWALVILAATAVAAWIITRTLIIGAPGSAHGH